MHSLRFYLIMALTAGLLLSAVIIGGIAVQASHRATGQDAISVVLFAAIFFALGASPAVVLVARITGPLNLLTRRISMMQSRGLAGSLPASGPLEVRMLAQAFNVLATSVSQSEALMQQSEEKFLQIADNIHDVIWMTDMKCTRIEYVNLAYEKIWGQSVQSIYADPENWMHSIVPEDRQRVIDAYAELSGGGEFSAEYSILRPDGTLRRIQDNAYAIADEFGKNYRIAGIARDITALTRSREQIEEQNHELEKRAHEVQKANQLQREFLTSVSHELRTPLNAISGFSELLMNDQEISEKKRGFASHIHQGGKRLLLLINDIMDVSKIEAGQMALSWSDFSLEKLIREEIECVAGQRGAWKIPLAIDCQRDLLICSDATRLEQILHNLLSNAIKFTPEGGDIGVELRIAHGFAEVTVWDTGAGIREEDFEVIFDRFRQVGATVRGTREGTGLGLSITAGLVKLLGGKISLQSKIGEGSRFTFVVPLQKSAPKRRKADAVRLENDETAMEVEPAMAERLPALSSRLM